MKFHNIENSYDPHFKTSFDFFVFGLLFCENMQAVTREGLTTRYKTPPAHPSPSGSSLLEDNNDLEFSL